MLVSANLIRWWRAKHDIVVTINISVLIELVQAPATGCRQAPDAGWVASVAAETMLSTTIHPL